jgi:aspartate aminotransferase-like enzyme
MPGPSPDSGGLLEYSVVFTERSLNHMSEKFQRVMRDISTTLQEVYSAAAVVVVPGGGTYGMEAIARQFAGGRRCLVIRNGYFSYRWSQIFQAGSITSDEIVIQARPAADGARAPWAPPPLDEVVAAIRDHEPDLVFAPHVDTSSGIILPGAYLAAVGEAVHGHGGMFVLDCVASGAVRVDMRESGVDVLVTAPQKGWSAPPSAGLVMLGGTAARRLEETRSSSFACDLRRWREIMKAYEEGGHAYHATMPTDALVTFRDSLLETVDAGLDEMERRQWELGKRVRELLAGHGFPSVAAPGFEAPGVVVSYTDDPLVRNGRKFAEAGLQVAGGVPLMCDEPDDFSSFRIGLFGLEKWTDVDGTVERLKRALEAISAPQQAGPR